MCGLELKPFTSKSISAEEKQAIYDFALKVKLLPDIVDSVDMTTFDTFFDELEGRKITIGCDGDDFYVGNEGTGYSFKLVDGEVKCIGCAMF